MKRSTIRYAAKSAYQLHLMRGLSQSTICGLRCTVHASERFVDVAGERVAIADCWKYL